MSPHTTQASLDKEKELDNLCINTIRFLAIDAVQKANSGHPGLPLGAAPMAYVLWKHALRFNPADPKWFNRDRFVLSAGHGSALLYSLLHLSGYDLSLDDLKNFRQLDSKTPGHPESTLTPGVEVTTGPLGQGFANGVGIAMAEAFLSAKYNHAGYPVVDHYTYGIVSDGDLMEGIASEAASLAGHLKLGKLIYLYDDNHISLDGPTSLAFTEDRLARFEAYGWHTQQVADGNDLDAIHLAIHKAQAVSDQPSIISVKTIIGYGSPQEGTNKVHGSALGEENVRKTKQFFGWDPDKTFFIPDQVKAQMLESGKKGCQLQSVWKLRFEAYKHEFPLQAMELDKIITGVLPKDWDADLPLFTAGESLATRQASGKAITAIKQHVPWLIGGSADLASSNDMTLEQDKSFQPGEYQHSNIWFGVREHAMGGILNGMAAHGLKTYGGTFLNFSDYMKGAIRLAALTEAPVTYVFTHDSIGLGEDGPTHQPIEQVMSLRAVPNLTVIRPADANETVEAWRFAMSHDKGPVALILSRQKLPTLDRHQYPSANNLLKGAYVLTHEQREPDIILIASGSELQLALDAHAVLQKENIIARVVSMPCWELFEQQPDSYRQQVFPKTVTCRLAIEAGATLGWYKYVGLDGAVIGIDRFGMSGPGEEVMKYFGFTVEGVCERVRGMVGKKA